MNITKKLSLIFCLIISLHACKSDDPEIKTQQPIKAEFKDYASIKSDDWKESVGKEITVEGYLVPVSNNTYKVVNDSLYAQVNTVLPDENYILLQGEANSKDMISLPEYAGARVKVSGILAHYEVKDAHGESLLASEKIIGPKSLATIRIKDLPINLGGKRYRKGNADLKDILDPHNIKPLSKNVTKYALLYSGGIDAMQAYSHYYNNIRVMYEILLTQGYEAENIVVVYKDGAPESIIPTTLPPYFKAYPAIPVNQAATPAGLDNAIAYLEDVMWGKNAELFLMITNHGGGFHIAENRNYAGQTDVNGDEPGNDRQRLDEVSTFYNTDRFISDDEFASKINSLPFISLKALFLQCFSGGFIHDFRGPNRVLMSATNENEYSWGGGNLDMDLFLFNFITPVYSTAFVPNPFDTNGDGKLSIYEIFIGARTYKRMDDKKYPQYSSSPQYDDDGDGVPNEPRANGFGATIFL